ncbi:MAG: AAA family ATPase, partial [Actinomycetota bacterium]
PLVGPVLAAAAFEEVEQLVTDYLAGRHTLFEERIQGGRIVDGHGDLRAEHIFCLDDGPRVIDCLAFRDDYRAGDVLADIAFLAMDLHRLVGPEAAAELVRSYDEFSNEHHPSSLAHHYVAYRAHVRAKVAAVRFQQGDRDAAAEVETYHALALEHLRAARVHLILVGGGAGVGKSTVAEGLARELGAVWLRSDEVRKSTAGIPLDEHRFEAPGEGIYAPEVTGEVYQQLLDQAEGLLTRGQSVVLDATWAAEGHRTMARQLAERTSSTLTELRCAAPLALAKERIARRMASLDEPSDATPEIAQFLADRFEAWPDAHTIDTSGSIADSITAACAVVTEPPDRPERPDVVTLSGAASMRVESIRFFLSRRRTLQQPRPSRPSVFDPTRDVDRR